MMATMNLRFVERETTVNTTAAGEMLPEGFARTINLRVLQQQWVSVVDSSSEWRDVPLVADGPNVRAKLAPTVWRAGRLAQHGPQALRRTTSVTRRWCSA